MSIGNSRHDLSYSDHSTASALSPGLTTRRSRGMYQKQTFTFEHSEKRDSETTTQSEVMSSSRGQRVRATSSSAHSNESFGESTRSLTLPRKPEGETINKNWIKILKDNNQQPEDDPRKDMMKKLIDKRFGLETNHEPVKRRARRARTRTSSSISSSAATGDENIPDENEEKLQRSVSNVDISTIALQEDEQLEQSNLVRKTESCDIVPTSDYISQRMVVPKYDESERESSEEVKVLTSPENSTKVLVTTNRSTEDITKSASPNQIVINILSSNPENSSATSINVVSEANGVTNVYVGTMPAVVAPNDRPVITSEPEAVEVSDKKPLMDQKEEKKKKCCFCF